MKHNFILNASKGIKTPNGKCEAIYRVIPSMHLQGLNIDFIFVQSGYPKNKSKFGFEVEGFIIFFSFQVMKHRMMIKKISSLQNLEDREII